MLKRLLCLLLMVSLLLTNALALVKIYRNGENLEPQHLVENRRFAAMPTVEVTGSRIWASWTSGGNTEPHDENFVAVAYSDDGGRTWDESYMILDPGAMGKAHNSVFWLDTTGRLWMFFSDNGSWSMYTDNPCDAPEEIIWSSPRKLEQHTVYNKPMAVQRGGEDIYLLPVANSPLKVVNQLYTAKPGDKKWKLLKGKYVTSENPATYFTEPVLVERSDGSLWMLSRVEKGYDGGVEQAFSYDDGKTWTALEGDLPYPLRGPGSRFQIRKLQSGHLVWISHDQTAERTNLTIWLSEDDGVTWPYKLLLDDRYSVSYPDITQAADGKIYVVYDKGRSTEQEIRLAIFTEEDIRAGAFVTEGAQGRMAVTKTGGYADILAFEEAFERRYTAEDEAAVEVIRASLPIVLHGVTDREETVVLEGEWKVTDVNEEGVMLRFFTTLPKKTQDLYSLLKIRIDWLK